MPHILAHTSSHALSASYTNKRPFTQDKMDLSTHVHTLTLTNTHSQAQLTPSVPLSKHVPQYRCTHAQTHTLQNEWRSYANRHRIQMRRKAHVIKEPVPPVDPEPRVQWSENKERVSRHAMLHPIHTCTQEVQLLKQITLKLPPTSSISYMSRPHQCFPQNFGDYFGGLAILPGGFFLIDFI